MQTIVYFSTLENDKITGVFTYISHFRLKIICIITVPVFPLSEKGPTKFTHARQSRYEKASDKDFNLWLMLITLICSCLSGDWK